MENKLIIGPDYLFLISSQYETRFIDYTLKTIKTNQKLELIWYFLMYNTFVYVYLNISTFQ